jgi:hypothetical protein
MKREVTTTMKRGEVEAPSRGWCPLSYIKVAMLLLSTHFESLSLSLPYCSIDMATLSGALPQIVRHQHLDKWRRRRSSGGSLLPLPHWNEGTEDVTEPYVWSSTEALPVVALGFAILRSTLDQLHLYRQRLCGNLIPSFSFLGWVTRCYHLLDIIFAS